MYLAEIGAPLREILFGSGAHSPILQLQTALGSKPQWVRTDGGVPKVVSIACSVLLARGFVNETLLRGLQRRGVLAPSDQELQLSLRWSLQR